MSLLFAPETEKNTCEQLVKAAKTKSFDVEKLNSLPFSAKDSFSTLATRGVKEAYYFSCNDNEGIVLVRTHNKDLIYRQVALDVWSSFKASEVPEQFYIQHIKYNHRLL